MVIVPSSRPQMLCAVGVASIIIGKGFTVIVYEEGVPAQPFTKGVTVIVAEIADVPLLDAVKLGTLPVPLAAAKPMLVFEFVQV
jgi:hypothetical protein